MSKQFYFPIYIGEHIEETAPLSLSARGALADFKVHSWNASTRGVLCEDLVGYARLFGSTVDTAGKVIDELTSENRRVLVREDCEDGKIRLTHPATVHRAKVSKARSEPGKKGVATRLLKQNAKQNSSNPLTLTMYVGGSGGNSDPPPPDDEEFDALPLEDKVRQWLRAWSRFPFETTSPLDMSKVVAMTERYGWEYVKSCLTIALDKNVARCVPYAEAVASRKAGAAFADKPAPASRGAKAAGWRAG